MAESEEFVPQLSDHEAREYNEEHVDEIIANIENMSNEHLVTLFEYFPDYQEVAAREILRRKNEGRI